MIRRHARLYAGHPRLGSNQTKTWMAGNERAFTPVFYGLCPAITTERLYITDYRHRCISITGSRFQPTTSRSLRRSSMSGIVAVLPSTVQRPCRYQMSFTR
jgi:hypothetical protein